MQKKPTFRMSPCVAHHTKDWKQSAHFYKDVMGLDVCEKDSHLEIKNDPILMYVQPNPGVEGMVMEYVVEDVELAKNYLLSHGCEIIKWEGKGKDCYMKDPFGFTFNLWEEKK
ncbi:MAG: hypothetical protein ISR83_03745 [Candidatus Marinimicrobia bacterium]|nr:hypothetical protein [Candidatus Neomarinimicrobiota bacterium]